MEKNMKKNDSESFSHSVMSDSLWPHGLQSARLLCPSGSLVKNSGVGCHAFLQEISPTQGSNPHLLRPLHWQAGSLLVVKPPGKPLKKNIYVCVCVCVCARMHGRVLSCFGCVNSLTPWTATCQAPPSMEFFRQEYWSGLPLSPPGDLLDPGIEPRASELQANSLPLSHQGSPVTSWWD